MAHRQNKSLEEYIGRGLNLQRSIRSTYLLSAMNTDWPESQKTHTAQRTTPWTWTQCETMYLRAEGRKPTWKKPNQNSQNII